MKKFFSPEAELLELDMADVICSSPIVPLEPSDPQGSADGGNSFGDED